MSIMMLDIFPPHFGFEEALLREKSTEKARCICTDRMGYDSKSSYDAAGTVLNLDEPPLVNSINHGEIGRASCRERV